MRILFIGKKNDQYAELAASYLKQIFPKTEIVYAGRGEKFPPELLAWTGDYVFSYLSPWVIPSSVIERASCGAINWHPGPPEYPGIGCTNFAIYDSAKEFGITCHHMAGKVDTGKIIEVLRFRIHPNDTVFSVTQKCYSFIYYSFHKIIEKIAHRETLPESGEHWTRKPYTRKELDSLCVIKLDMATDEITRRIKATTYDRPWAYIEINGAKFVMENKI